MPRTFSASRALGIPPKDYDAYFEGGLPPSAMPFNPDRGYSSRGSMVTPTDAFSDQFRAFGTNQALKTLDARKDLLDGGAGALLEPENREQRLDYMLRGAISPHEEYQMERMERVPPEPRLSKYSPVPVEVAKAASELDYIDPTEPGALEKRNQILRDIDNHPEWGGSNLKTHPYFQDKDQKFLHNYYAHKHLAGNADHTAEKADLSEIHRALTSDVPTDALRPFLDPEMRRITDHAGFADVMAKAAHNKAALTPKSKEKLLELQLAAQTAALTDPSIPQKEAWLTAQGIDPANATADQWSQAWSALKVEPMQAYHAFRQSLGLHDFANPSPAHPPPSSPEALPPAPEAPAQDEGTPDITTQAQFDALPPGSVFMSNGKSYRKK